jgi:homocysteine S-methyltransferase
MSPRLLDGGTATALRAVGLPGGEPVEPWVLDHPAAVGAVHAAFVSAGSSIVLASTFRALPALTENWERIATQAAAIARASGASEVWASIGPRSTFSAPWVSGPGGWAELTKLLDPWVDGFALETFVRPAEALAALDEVRGATGKPVCVSLVPSERGGAWTGEAWPPVARRLRGAGADVLGFNCASPAAIARAVCACEGPLWAKPSRDATPDPDWAIAAAEIARHVDYLGGCCGVSPEDIRRLRERLSPDRR